MNTNTPPSSSPEDDLIGNLDISDEMIAERRIGSLDNLPDDMPAYMQWLIRNIDTFSYKCGYLVSFLLVPIFLSMCYEIFVRKFFVAPTLWAFDISRMFYGALFMLGSAYALSRGVHIRADFLYRTLSERTQGIIDFVLYLILYLPAMLTFFYFSSEFAYESILRNEKIADTAWLPIIWPLKSVLAISVLLLCIQGFSETLKSYYAATRGRWPV